ncbi:MAG: hypothetical protein FWH26_08260 [Oscillospiraceae bacterium]|nr:hypothetical protein [Oscillospiraceae bacterium]
MPIIPSFREAVISSLENVPVAESVDMHGIQRLQFLGIKETLVYQGPNLPDWQFIFHEHEKSRVPPGNAA